MQQIESIVAAALAEFAGCEDAVALENSKAKYLGKTGQLTELLRSLGGLPAAARPAAGARIPRRLRCATWKHMRHRSRSSRRDASTASTAMRRTRRCSTRSRVCGSTKT